MHIDCAGSHKVCVSAFWAHSGLWHFTCKFPYKVALVKCWHEFRLRRLAQSVCPHSGLILACGILPANFCIKWHIIIITITITITIIIIIIFIFIFILFFILIIITMIIISSLIHIIIPLLHTEWVFLPFFFVSSDLCPCPPGCQFFWSQWVRELTRCWMFHRCFCFGKGVGFLLLPQWAQHWMIHFGLFWLMLYIKGIKWLKKLENYSTSSKTCSNTSSKHLQPMATGWRRTWAAGCWADQFPTGLQRRCKLG